MIVRYSSIAVENDVHIGPKDIASSLRHPQKTSPPLHPQLFSSTTQCICCAAAPFGKFERELGDGTILHTYEHGPLACSLYKRACPCGATYHYTFTELPDGKVVLADGALQQDYFMMAGAHGGHSNHGYQLKLLEMQRRNVTAGHLTFTACVETYLDAYSDQEMTAQMDLHSLTDNYFAYNALVYLDCMQILKGLDISRLLTRKSRRESMDEFLLDCLPRLRACFSRFWGIHFLRPIAQNGAMRDTIFENISDQPAHSRDSPEKVDEFAQRLMPLMTDEAAAAAAATPEGFGCGDPSCSATATVDGHMKVNRATCQTESKYIRFSPELGGLLMQCPNRPA